MIEIKKIIVGGFTNIKKVELVLQDITGLLSLNNYGKSNVFKAISFGVNFLQKDGLDKFANIMYQRDNIPLNNSIAGKDFEFEIELKTDNRSSILYGYSFTWPTNTDEARMTGEYLKIKEKGERKFKSLIKRDKEKCLYLSSLKGRCDTLLKIDSHQLAINKLINYDNLHYHSSLEDLFKVKIKEINTLADPKSYFEHPNEVSYVYMDKPGKKHTAIPSTGEMSRFLYYLMKEEKRKYNLFQDAIGQLLPDIVSLEPVKIELKKETQTLREKVPFDVSEASFNVLVKDRNLNQKLSINKLSDGSKRILYVLLMAIAVERAGVGLLMVEELENSIHPSLFQKLLIVLKTFAKNTKVLFTSHSPYLIQYIKPELLYIGLPDNDGVARFLKFKKSKTNSFFKEASEYGLSSGDYLFNLLIQDADTRKEKEQMFFEI